MITFAHEDLNTISYYIDDIFTGIGVLALDNVFQYPLSKSVKQS